MVIKVHYVFMMEHLVQLDLSVDLEKENIITISSNSNCKVLLDEQSQRNQHSSALTFSRW